MKTKTSVKNSQIKIKETVPRFPAADVKYDFPVDFQNLRTTSGIIVPGKRAVVRTDTKKVLGVVGTEYKILPNKYVLDQIESTLPVSLQTRKISVCEDGQYMFARYMSPKIKPITVAKGDIIQFGVEIVNAYNGRMSLLMRMFALRLVCTNGMTTPHGVSTIQVRHVGSANLIEARKEFEMKVQLFQDYGDVWKSWLKVTPKETQINEFLEKRISSQIGRDIIRNKFETDKDRSLWGFFNAVTFYGTHIRKPKFVTNRDESNPNKLVSVVGKHRDAAKMQFSFAQRVIEPFYAVEWSK